jgi:hypothetical protein
MPATTDALIMLYVDTESIIELDPTDKSQDNLDAIADCCFISSNNTDSASTPEEPGSPSSRRNFTTDLYSNSQIAWVGAVQNIIDNPNDYVLISDIIPTTDDIKIKIGPKQPNSGNGNPGSGDTHIDGIVKSSHGGLGSQTIYSIIFTVCHNGTPPKDGYQIDPKLNMKN